LKSKEGGKKRAIGKNLVGNKNRREQAKEDAITRVIGLGGRKKQGKKDLKGLEE